MATALVTFAQGIRSAGYNVTLAEGAVTLHSAESEGSSWTAQGDIDLSGVRVEPLPVTLPSSAWQVKFTANQAGLKADDRLAAEAVLDEAIPDFSSRQRPPAAPARPGSRPAAASRP